MLGFHFRTVLIVNTIQALCCSRPYVATGVVPYPSSPSPLSSLWVLCLLCQAAAAVNAQQYQVAESFFLKAKRPDAALAMYRDAGQWQAALKLAEAYLPNSVQVHAIGIFEHVVTCTPRNNGVNNMNAS